MKLLLSEEWYSHIYAEPFFQRFRELGVEAHAFKEFTYFGGNERDESPSRVGNLLGRVQRKLNAGPAYLALNRALLHEAEQLRPDAVFLFRGNNIFPDTIRTLHSRGVHVLGWNNDNPFSATASESFWHRFVEGIPLYNRLWAYRPANVEDFRGRGCPKAGLLQSFYLRELNFPVADVSGSPFRAQVSFLGHWENDGRDAFVDPLLREPKLDFKLWGTVWERSRLWPTLQKRFQAVRPLFREDYNLAINSTEIALVFLSKLNADTYTRRCFEIPITGTMMLSQRTDDLKTLFREGEEAEFFGSPEELVEKVRFYLKNEAARRKIGQAGRARVLRDGHEVLDRAKTVLETLERDLAERR